MSKTDSLHYELCLLGAKYLKSKKGCEPWRTPNKYIAVELVTFGPELTDIWATNGYDSTVIEVKVSHSDFINDKNKISRKDEELSMGNFRYYLCPEDIIDKKELPSGWGLLYWDGKNIHKIVQSTFRKDGAFKKWDVTMLSSILNRISKPQIFNFRNKSIGYIDRCTLEQEYEESILEDINKDINGIRNEYEQTYKHIEDTLEAIVHDCSRLTSANISHNAACIQGIAQRQLDYIRMRKEHKLG